MKAIDSHPRDESMDSRVEVPQENGHIIDSPSSVPKITNGDISPLKLNGVNGHLNGHHIIKSEIIQNVHNTSELLKTNGLLVNGVNGQLNNKTHIKDTENTTLINGHNTDIKLNGVNKTTTINGHITNGHGEKKIESEVLPVNGIIKNKIEKVNGVHSVNGIQSVPTNGVNHESSGLVNGHVSATNGDSVRDPTVVHLEDRLLATQHELRLRDEEVARLTKIRTEVESELEDLTASLFQEAHNMVRQANVQQAQAEKNLKESQMKVEVLQAEVAALKTLVLTSTPSRPNPHLHPQLQPDASPSQATSGMNLFNRKHRRSPSHFNLKYGRENSPPDSPVKEVRGSPVHQSYGGQPDLIARDDLEVDPIIHKEFLTWKQTPRMDRTDPFIARVYREDIELCLDFCNVELGTRVRKSIEACTVFIEEVTEKSRTVFPKKCALMEVPRLCHYRMRLGDEEQWFHISQICRNRITAVCDFLNYLRYIERGLVKSSVHDVFWEIVRLRKEIVLARLGLPLS